METQEIGNFIKSMNHRLVGTNLNGTSCYYMIERKFIIRISNHKNMSTLHDNKGTFNSFSDETDGFKDIISRIKKDLN